MSILKRTIIQIYKTCEFKSVRFGSIQNYKTRVSMFQLCKTYNKILHKIM